jgi:uncharacterized protein (DUF2132 family)
MPSARSAFLHCHAQLINFMANLQNPNPLQGVTLEKIVTQLAEHYGWEELGKRINIRCFQSEPSVKSSLKFLRKTPWAREKVESLFVATFAKP